MSTLDDAMYWLPGWASAALLLLLLLGSTAIGHRGGVRTRARRGDAGADGSHLGTIQGAVLGLLALLLAFTFSAAAGRADARKRAVVDEANAIGTAWLRAGLLADPHRPELRRLLRQYARTRIVPDAVNRDRLAAVVAESAAVQSRLWPAAERAVTSRGAGGGSAASPVDALLVQAVNDVLDAHTDRVAASRDRVPGAILLMLAVIAAASLAMTGYGGGLAGRPDAMMTTLLAVLVAAVAYVIVDLDHPRSGLVRVSQQSLVELLDGMPEADGLPPVGGPAAR